MYRAWFNGSAIAQRARGATETVPRGENGNTCSNGLHRFVKARDANKMNNDRAVREELGELGGQPGSLTVRHLGVDVWARRPGRLVRDKQCPPGQPWAHQTVA